MSTSIRIHTQVLPGHRIEIRTPQLSEGVTVDVLVTPTEAPVPSPTDPREILRLPIEQRRILMAAQAERLAEYYNSAPDRSGWQGGDIVK